MPEARKQQPALWLVAVVLAPALLLGLVLCASGPWQARSVGCVLLAACAIVALRMPSKTFALAVVLLVWLVVLTLTLIWKRHPSAWALVWCHMLMGLPFSLPFIVYWADGVRPNLIYRHRFERLVPEITDGVV